MKINDENYTIDKLAQGLSNLFKVFGDSTRLKIMKVLEVQPCFVGEIAEKLNMTLSAVSHQLRILRDAKLVKGIKNGKEVLYSIDDDHVTQIINIGQTHILE